MELYDKLRSEKSGQQPSVFIFTFKISSGRTEVPAPMVGAYVVAYTIAETGEAAVERAAKEL